MFKFEMRQDYMLNGNCIRCTFASVAKTDTREFRVMLNGHIESGLPLYMARTMTMATVDTTLTVAPSTSHNHQSYRVDRICPSSCVVPMLGLLRDNTSGTFKPALFFRSFSRPCNSEACGDAVFTSSSKPIRQKPFPPVAVELFPVIFRFNVVQKRERRKRRFSRLCFKDTRSTELRNK